MAINWREIAGGFDQHEPEWYHASGYEIAVKNGYRGTKEQWLDANIAAQDDGEAALQEDESGGGSGGGLVVNFTLEAGTGDYDGYYIWVTETPAADVIAAIKAGTNVVFYLPGNGEVGIPADCWIPVTAYVEPLGGATTNAPFGNLLSSQSSFISSATIVDGEIIIEAYID